MPTVDGEDLEQAEAVKYETLEGPSEEELSKAREAEVAYVPPGEEPAPVKRGPGRPKKEDS
jgi:hypothetical protein